MGKNKFENFIFSFMVCFLMVCGMTIYNTFLQVNDAENVLSALDAVIFMQIFAVAFVIEWFVVGPLVKAIVTRSTNDKTPFIKKVMMISGLMVLFMCTAMSLVATLIQGYEGSLLSAFAVAFILNILCALPLQFVLVGPVARMLFFRFFPVTVMA